MAHEGIPVNKIVIAWARDRAGLSLEEATQKFPKIAAWEAGQALPTYPQLEQMSEEFRLPVAVFFFPEPPAVPAIRESFRTLPETAFRRLPRRIAHLLRKAKAFQLGLDELCRGRNPAPRMIVRDLEFKPGTPVEVMAERVRVYLRISLDEQAAWTDDEDALKMWRKALHDVGIFVFKDAFRQEDFSGFSLYDEQFPLIYVNNSSAKTRQIFTLFHELAHLLFRTSGIDPIDATYVDRLPLGQRQIELLCNRFAAQFLVPDAAFAAAFAGQIASEATAERLARRFHVSREFIYRKFLDRGLVTEAAYAGAAKRWAEQKQAGSGGNPYWSKLAYLGREYVALAFSQYHQNRIDDVQLGEYLDMKPKNVAILEEYFERSGR